MPEKSDFPFDFEFFNRTNLPDDKYYTIAYAQITEARKGHSDIVGASVSLEELSSDETPHAYQAQVVLYVRPDNIVAKEIMESAMDALQRALDEAIRQVREKREKLKNY
jgi:hypothetical protein